LHQLEEVVEICRLMWTEAHPTFHGEYFTIDDAAATPRPDVVPPVCIGAQGEQVALPVVGRCADMWNLFFPGDDEWKRKRAIVDAAAEAAGRDPASIASCVTVAGDLPDSDAASEEWLERVRHLAELGIAHVVFDFGHPLDPEPAERFGEQVIDQFRS
jgi:alkanesulfonate monooxygenase SsuD/methylene tetrahydromethanopterin reductase-like flavin-dependent oxidoreductase (luciferase family)